MVDCNHRLVLNQTKFEKKLKVFGIVISIRGETYFSDYRYAEHGKFIKGSKLSSECLNCGLPSTRTCYRLSLEVDTESAVKHIIVYGKCLDQYFGVSSCCLFKSTKSCEQVVRLRKCVQDYFVGQSFYFFINISSSVQNNLLQREFLANDLTPVVPFDSCTIFSKFCLIEPNQDFEIFQRSGLLEEAEIKPSLNKQTCLEEEPASSCKSNKKKPTLCRSLSDSFMFFQDSLMSSLLEECNSSNFSSVEDNIGLDYDRNRSAYYKLSDDVPSSNFRLSCSTVAKEISFEDVSCELLDVTLPALNIFAESCKRIKPTLFINSSGVPKLRRCRSVACDSKMFNSVARRKSSKLKHKSATVLSTPKLTRLCALSTSISASNSVIKLSSTSTSSRCTKPLSSSTPKPVSRDSCYFKSHHSPVFQQDGNLVTQTSNDLFSDTQLLNNFEQSNLLCFADSNEKVNFDVNHSCDMFV